MIDYVNKDLFGVDSISKEWTITVTKTENNETTTIATFHNNDISYNSIYLTEAISSSDGLVFGRCESSRFEFTVYYDQIPTPANYKTYKGYDITVDLVLNGDTENPFRVGKYIVDEDKATADRHHRKIVAYDKLYKLADKDVAEWYKTLQFPMTIKAFRDSFFTYIGFTQETATLCNDNITIYKTLDADEELSAISILQAICEINGAFGHIGRDDIFHYIVLDEIIEGLFPAEDLYPSDDLYPRDEAIDTSFFKNQWSKVEYEDYRVKKMDGVIVMDEEGKIAGYTSQDLKNPFKLENNFLTYNINNDVYTTIANNLYSVIGHCWYMVASVDCPSNLCVEVGDRIRVNTQEKIIYMYVLYRNMSGIQLLQDKLESSGDEDRSKDLSSVSKQLARLRSKSKWEFEANSARIGELEADHVTVAQLTATNGRVDNLSSSVAIIDTKLYAAQAEIVTLQGTDATFSGEITALKAKCSNLTVNGTLKANKIVSTSGEKISIDCLDGAVVAQTLSGNSIACGSLQSPTCNFGFVSMSAGSTVGGKTILTSDDMSTINSNISNGDYAVKVWVADNFVAK